MGAFAPYGYQKNPENKNHLIIDEEAAQVVRNIYRWFVYDGMSKVGIAKHLNKLGVLTPINYKHQKGLSLHTPQGHKNDGLWAVTTISTILQNQMYTGTMVQGKYRFISYKVHRVIQPPKEEWYVVEKTHEPIIDQALFDKAQQIGKRRTRTAPTQKRVHLFSGFLRCADCGRSMTRKASRKKTKSGTKEYVYYVCSTYAFKSKDTCSRHSIKLEDLTEAVLQTIQTQISLVEDMATMIRQIHPVPMVDSQMKQLKEHQHRKQVEIGKLEDVIDSLYIDWKSEYLTRTEYFRMKAKFEQQMKQLKKTMKQIEEEMYATQKTEDMTASYLNTFLKHKNIQNLDRRLLIELVDHIRIHEHQTITFHFTFKDQHKHIMEFMDKKKVEHMTH